MYLKSVCFYVAEVLDLHCPLQYCNWLDGVCSKAYSGFPQQHSRKQLLHHLWHQQYYSPSVHLQCAGTLFNLKLTLRVCLCYPPTARGDRGSSSSHSAVSAHFVFPWPLMPTMPSAICLCVEGYVPRTGNWPSVSSYCMCDKLILCGGCSVVGPSACMTTGLDLHNQTKWWLHQSVFWRQSIVPMDRRKLPTSLAVWTYAS